MPTIADESREALSRLLASLDDPTAFLTDRDEIYKAATSDGLEYAVRIIDAAFAAGVIEGCQGVLDDIVFASQYSSPENGEQLQNAISMAVGALDAALSSLKIVRGYDIHPQLFFMRCPTLAHLAEAASQRMETIAGGMGTT